MRTITIISASLVLALTMPANAAPLYLRCEGRNTSFASGTAAAEPALEEPVSYSIKIDGATVEVDGQPAGQISNISDYVWRFGNEKISGTVNRITGSASLTFPEVASALAGIGFEHPFIAFSGTCHKAEKLF
jgi:hypothetical protein